MVRASRGHLQILQRDRVEIVVGQRDEAKSQAPQFDHLTDNGLHVPLAWLLSVRSPHRTKRAMLRAAAHRLDRRPHVAIGRQEIPSCGEKTIGAHTTAFVDVRKVAVPTILEHARPHHVAIPLDHAVSGTPFGRLFREQCRVDTAEDDPGASAPRFETYLIPAQRVTRVNPDPDHIARLHPSEIDRLERFVHNDGLAEVRWRRRRDHIEPPRSNHRRAERNITGVDQVNCHQ